jgi:hypothetical protein
MPTPTPTPDDIAHAILANEKRKAHAKAVLNRPASTIPAFVVAMLVVGAGMYLQSVEQFEAPMWVSVLLIACVSCSMVNMMDLWTTRRRLDAAIILLHQQPDADS